MPDPEGGVPPMRPYETMVIFDTGADEAAVNGVLDQARAARRAKGGTPGKVERWGKRAFAYEVQHKREGYYVVIELLAEPSAGADMERVLVLADASGSAATAGRVVVSARVSSAVQSADIDQ
jgi:small subunit ribosomal protein S6